MIQKIGSRGDRRYCFIWLLDDICAKEFVPKFAHQTVMLYDIDDDDDYFDDDDDFDT